MTERSRPEGDIQCHFRCKGAYNAASADREPLAQIAQAENTTVLSRGMDGKMTERPAEPGMKLYDGDVVKTGAGGSAALKEASGPTLSLGPNSNFTVDQYIASPDQSSTLGQLAKGAAYGVSSLIKAVEPEPPATPTPVFAIGIRG